MPIDIRASVTCSLGTLISGSISDDYLQGSGLVKSRGSCEVSGLVTPAVGTSVTFSYTKAGITRTIPRTLRVLSSFADPFRRTTKIELGCKLTYMSDLQDSIKWTAFDDNENNDYDEDDQRIVTLPIRASSIMTKCLAEIGISASSSPLTNKFSIAEFDFSPGYVQVLSDLLVSESYFGYLDANEVLQIINLDQEATPGPAYTATDIVDIGPIGTGQLPGEAVTVSYSTLKLKQPEVNSTPTEEEEEEVVQRINWELDVTTGSPQTYYVNYKLNGAGSLLTKTYEGFPSSKTFTDYGLIKVYDEATKKYKNVEVVKSRSTTTRDALVSVTSSIAQVYLQNGIDFSGGSGITSVVNEIYSYPSEDTVIQTTTKYVTEAEIVASLSIPLVFDSGQVINVGYGLMASEQLVVVTTKVNDMSKQVTSTYKLFGFTQPGQQQTALTSENSITYEEAQEMIGYVFSGLVHDTTTVQTQTSGSTTSTYQRRPESIVKSSYADGGDPNNGWRTESKAELALALGSATAQRRIEFSMPYAPDDVFSGPSGGPFTAVASDASVKAMRYGRVQNRLLLGNRSGVNIQVAPDRLPNAPFDSIFIAVTGLASMYRTNGNQWAFDSSGIVCSTDALYWGVAGKS